MTIRELIRFSLAARCPVSIYFEMRRGIWRIMKRNIFPAKNYTQRPLISIDRMRKSLNKMNLSKSDTVFVHSGIGNIGVIEGGRKAVFELLAEYVTPETGNLLFPTFPFYKGVYDYLENLKVFDVRTAPSYMGTLTQYVLEKQIGIRSISPTHPVVAVGKDAEYLSKAHHKDTTPFGSNSPFQRFLQLNNPKVLLIGVSTDAATMVHNVEDVLGDKFPIKTFMDKIYEINCIDWDGSSLKVKTGCHSPVVSLSRDITRFDGIYRREKAITCEVPVGLSSIAILDAKKFFEVLTNLALQGKTIYGATHFTLS